MIQTGSQKNLTDPALNDNLYGILIHRADDPRHDASPRNPMPAPVGCNLPEGALLLS